MHQSKLIQNMEKMKKYRKNIGNTSKIDKILAGKLLERAAKPELRGTNSSSQCAEGSSIASVAGPVQGTGGPVHRPNKPEF